jgi:dTDP-4-amino-4,6-dideoxygalactose transaminase
VSPAAGVPGTAGLHVVPAESEPLRVPLFDLRPQNESIRQDALDAIARVCDSQQFVLGREVAALERELGDRFRVRHAIGMSSGTDALIVALMAAGIGPGDEVITSAFTFFATAGSITRVGARPVFVDIDPATFNLDPAAVDAAIGPHTRALVPVHLYGLVSDMDALLEIAARHGVPVIEDACQAIGSRYGDRFAGTMGGMGCFSFYPTKNLGGFGDGGLLVTHDDQIAKRARLLREHGAEARYHHSIVGGNFRLDELQAAVLRVKATRLDRWIESRRRNAQRYVRLFEDAGLGSAVIPPVEPGGTFHTYHLFVVRVSRRDELRAHLTAKGVGTGVYYPVPLHRQECFAALGYQPGSLPHAERAARDTIALPVYPELTAQQQDYVVDCIADFVRHQ